MNIEHGPGKIYMLGDPPNCPVHKGPMKFDFAMDRYECAGWDGEGCDEHIDAEKIELGDVMSGTFHFTINPGKGYPL